MKIHKVVNELHLAVASTEHGKATLTGKRYLLHAGVVAVTFLDKEIHVPAIVIPSIGALPQWDMPEYPEMTISGGTTDAQVLCIARRGFTQRQNGTIPEDSLVPIPTLDEATKENVSGKDLYGEPWPVPRVPTVPIDEAIEAGRAR